MIVGSRPREEMAQGIVLPQLKTNMSFTRATQRPLHIDNRDDIKWTLPPINGNRTSVANNARQSQTIGAKNKRRRINKLSNEMRDIYHTGRDNDRVKAGQHQTKRMSVIGEEPTLSQNASTAGLEMFNRMSTEAQEAYNEILKEMKQHERTDANNYKSQQSHAEIGDENECLKECEEDNFEKPQSLSHKHLVSREMEDKVNIGERAQEIIQPTAVQTVHNNQHQYLALPPLLPRVIHTEPSNKLSKRKRRKNNLNNTVPILECKAPISHTAARVGRKKKLEWIEIDDDDLSIVKPASVIGSGLDTRGIHVGDRQFEITPMGYDSRYKNLQTLHAYQSEDDDDLVGFVLERATVKCQHWLEHQTQGYK